MYLDRLFKMMAEKQASDLFISCGAPISMKINGVVTALTNQKMDIDTVRRIRDHTRGRVRTLIAGHLSA